MRSEAFDSLVELNGQCLELLADQALVQPAPGQSAVAPGWGDLAHAGCGGPTARRFVSLPTGRCRILRSGSLAVVAGAARARARRPRLMHRSSRCRARRRWRRQVFMYAWHLAQSKNTAAQLLLGMPTSLHATDQLVHVAADSRARRAAPGVDASEVADESESVAGAVAGRGLGRGHRAGECPDAWGATARRGVSGGVAALAVGAAGRGSLGPGGARPAPVRLSNGASQCRARRVRQRRWACAVDVWPLEIARPAGVRVTRAALSSC